MTDTDLVTLAGRARAKAYAPYSGYHVGAAILSGEGNVFAGCNVENAAYPVGSCAEAGAISAMIARGDRAIARIVIVGGPAQTQDDGVKLECVPCGACRQRIAEFSDIHTQVGTLVDGEVKWQTIGQLLPQAFGPADLNN